MKADRKAESNLKMMDVKEFMDLGLLQEVNRQFLHPLGLALVAEGEGVDWHLMGIWDSREDPDSIVFMSFDEPKEIAANKFIKERHANRLKGLGFIIQPQLFTDNA